MYYKVQKRVIIRNRLTNVLPKVHRLFLNIKQKILIEDECGCGTCRGYEKAKKMASNITKPEVEKAAVLITGNTALVGILYHKTYPTMI